jgi:hypothetical protein
MPGSAACADELRASRKLHVAHAIAARRKREWRAGACGLVERPLQRAALILAAAGAQAELGGIDAERRDRCNWCGGARRRSRGADAGGRCGQDEEVAAIDVHGADSLTVPLQI